MEDVILKRYEEAKKELQRSGEIQTGIHRYEPMDQTVIRGVIAAVLVSILGMIMSMIFDPDENLFLVFSFAVCILAVVMVAVDKKSDLRTVDKKIKAELRFVDRLYEILVSGNLLRDGSNTDLKINTRERVEILIELYEPYLVKTRQRAEGSYQVWSSVIGVAGTAVLSISTCMGLTEYGPVICMILAVYFLLFIIAGGAVLRAGKNLSPKKMRYEGIVRDLRLLLLLKY